MALNKLIPMQEHRVVVKFLVKFIVDCHVCLEERLECSSVFGSCKHFYEGHEFMREGKSGSFSLVQRPAKRILYCQNKEACSQMGNMFSVAKDYVEKKYR